MDSPFTERTPDLITTTICPTGKGIKPITTANAATVFGRANTAISTLLGNDASTHRPLQLSSPPDSSTSSSPSPSMTDMTLCSTSSALNSVASTPVRRLIPKKNKGKPTCETVRDQPNNNRYYTPGPTRSCSEIFVYEDNCRPQSMSESALSRATLAEGPKRRAPSSPLQRPRAQSQMRERPQSMMSLQQNRIMVSSQQQEGFASRYMEGRTPPPQLQDAPPSHHDFSPDKAQKDKSFWDSSDDPVEVDSNKKPKSELRGTTGRRAREVRGDNRPRTLRRRSTNSMIAALCIDFNDNEDDAQEHRLSREGSQASPMSSVIYEDQEPSVHCTPPVRQRRPLADISYQEGIDVSTKDATDIRRIEHIEKMPAAGGSPMAPLVIRQPRRGPTRQRLTIVDPFPLNPSYWNEYANDTFIYLLEIEARYDRFVYMDSHSSAVDNREKLVLWMMELCYGPVNALHSTVHTAVHILDRYMTVKGMDSIPQEHLQGVGICAIMIACKLEENNSAREDNEGQQEDQDIPHVNSVEGCTRYCNLYTYKHLASTEVGMLVALKFELLVASATGFSDYFKRAIPAHPLVTQLIDFLCDLSLVSHKFLDFNTSQIAAAALWIALCAVNQDWNEELAILTGYSRKDLTHCSLIFRELVFSSTDTRLILCQELQRTFGAKYPHQQLLDTLTKVLG